MALLEEPKPPDGCLIQPATLIITKIKTKITVTRVWEESESFLR